jgi:hypothetical protein
MPDAKRLIGFGVLTWLVPFLASVLFYGPGGTLLVDEGLFKSLMIVIGGGVGALLLVLYFRRVKECVVCEAWILGVTWLAINWVLDLAVLLPLSRQTPLEYFAGIGLRYFVILFMALAVGYSRTSGACT